MNKHGKMSPFKARPVDLRATFIRRIDLSYANLERANLSGADCTNAIFRGANFRNAVFKGTILRGADLRDALNLTKKQVSEAITDANTLLPQLVEDEEHFTETK